MISAGVTPAVEAPPEPAAPVPAPQPLPELGVSGSNGLDISATLSDLSEANQTKIVDKLAGTDTKEGIWDKAINLEAAKLKLDQEVARQTGTANIINSLGGLLNGILEGVLGIRKVDASENVAITTAQAAQAVAIDKQGKESTIAHEAIQAQLTLEPQRIAAEERLAQIKGETAVAIRERELAAAQEMQAAQLAAGSFSDPRTDYFLGLPTTRTS